MIRDILKKFCFLILKDVTRFHGQENKTTLLLNVMIQIQSSIKLKTRQGRCNKEIQKKQISNKCKPQFCMSHGYAILLTIGILVLL